MSWSSARALVPLVCGILLAGCVSEQELDWQSHQVELAYEHQIGVVSEPDFLPHLEELALRLRPESADDASPVYVLDLGVPGAFLLPNGAIFITRGMLLMLNSEEELAMLLAHELAHHQEEHGLKSLRRSRMLRLASMLTLPLMIVTGPPDQMEDNIFGVMMPSYSRGHERKADALGMSFVQRAGFDVHCATELYRSLMRLDQRAGGKDRGFFSTHPAPEERLETLRRDSPPNRSCARSSYLERLRGMLLQRLDEPVYEDPDGRTVLVDLSLAFAPLADVEVQVKRSTRRAGYGLRVEDPVIALGFKYHAGKGIDWGRKQANAWSFEPDNDRRKLLLDEPEAGGRPDVRLAFSTQKRGSRVVEVFHWLETDEGVYGVHAEFAEDDWVRAEPLLLDLVANVQVVPKSAFASLALLPKIDLITTVSGDTLASIAAQYPGWDVDELAFYNGLDAEEPLRSGSLLKVVKRTPLPKSRHPRKPSDAPKPWEREPIRGD